MSLKSLLDELKSSVGVDGKTEAICVFLDGNSTDSLEVNADENQSLVAQLTDTVNFPSDPNGDAVFTDKGFPESCRYGSLMCDLFGKLARKMDESDEDGRRDFFAKCLPHYLMLIAQLQRGINRWCDKESECIANEALKKILSLGRYKSVEEALDAKDLQVLKTTLQKILPNLTREKWRQSCASRSAFIYVIERSSGDILSENLDAILPFILTLTDDFVLGNSVAGIKCMNLILNEVPPSELRLRGRAEVAHDALFKKLYTREALVAKALLPCILQSLNVLEPEMMRKRGCSIPKHDDCFDTILNNFHLSSDAAVRRIYAKAIPSFISRMGIHSIGHMRTITIVIEFALDISELPIISNCAKIVSTLVDAAWPRIAQHSERLLELLVKALYSIENDEWRTNGAREKQKTQTTNELVQAMAKLALVSKDLVKETADMLESEGVLGLKNHSLQLKQLLETVP